MNFNELSASECIFPNWKLSSTKITINKKLNSDNKKKKFEFFPIKFFLWILLIKSVDLTFPKSLLFLSYENLTIPQTKINRHYN